MRVPIADLHALHAPLRDELLAALARVVDTSALCLGPEVARFEAAWADHCGVAHAIGVGSGTDALLAALLALGVGPGDEVVVPALTFVATVGAVHFVGARPVLADVDPHTLTLDPAAVAAVVTPSTRAVVPVHLFGQCADMAALAAACPELVLLEDAAQAHGARYRGRRAGALGRLATFSFYPSKNLGALGDAGAVTTDDDALAERLRAIRSQGQVGPYDHATPGLNLRMSGFQGAALGVKLPHLDRWNARRAAIAARYLEAWAELPLTLPHVGPGNDHVFHQFVVRVDDRDAFRDDLAALGVATAVHYPRPVHLTAAYARLGRAGDHPVAEDAAARCVSLPVHAQLTDAQVEHVVTAVASVMERRRSGHR